MIKTNELINFSKSLIFPILIMGIMVLYINNMFNFNNLIIDVFFKFITSVSVFYIVGILSKQEDILKLYKMGLEKLFKFIY